AEIIVIALGTVADQPLMTQFAVLAGIGVVMTVGVYGLVAGIVKLDDAGAWLLANGRGAMQRLGRLLLLAAPKLMKLLTVVGTAAMFLVGGGILAHGITPIHHAIAHLAEASGWLAPLTSMALDAVLGIVAGALVVLLVTLYGRFRGQRH
ncbi:MAG: DUF808 domain-containing protein, partial [Azonexus sp.]|nr:DUF808 domain-containing protein [Azonexus sp.]